MKLPYPTLPYLTLHKIKTKFQKREKEKY
jgi:hypothetical protein